MMVGRLKKVCPLSKKFCPLTFLLLAIFISALLVLIPPFGKKISQENHIVAQQEQAATTITLAQTAPTIAMPVKTIVTVKPNDSLFKIFYRAQLSRNDLSSLIRSTEIKSKLSSLHPGQKFQFFKDEKNKLIRIIFKVNYQKSVQIDKFGNKFKSKWVTNSLGVKQILAGFTVKNSIARDAKQNKVPPNVSKKLISLFNGPLYAAKKIHRGDKIKIIYQKFYDGDQAVATGDILAAKIVTHKKNYEAIQYNGHYYDQTGQSLTPAFVRYPLKFKCVSSPFTLKRWHPVLHVYRAHEGVDLAAPTGTPIKAASDGVILEEKYNSGYGNVIVLKHNKKYSTLYAHLSRFSKKIKPGDHVNQGQIIGYVGQTGLATGPHLHYEFHIGNTKVDPLKVKLPFDHLEARHDINLFRALASNINSKFNATLA